MGTKIKSLAKRFLTKKIIFLVVCFAIMVISFFIFINLYHFLDYRDFIHFFVYSFFFIVVITSSSMFFSNINKFDFAAYVKTTLESVLFLHFYMSLTDMIASCDFAQAWRLAIGAALMIYDNIPLNIVVACVSLFVGILFKKKFADKIHTKDL